ncbi:hypothetical protein S40288_02479 [Stachybotrys chartarum IBT 40288]|nr:hypothetical protein S40288_02479 [Stachybotrys chartarum IBT 40288]
MPPPPPGVTPNPAASLILASNMSPAVLPRAPEEPLPTPATATLPVDHGFPLPKLRLEVRDLLHPGTKMFLDAVNTTDCVTAAIRNLLRLLYHSPACPTTTVPPTRSVTLILRDMGGVAFTRGSELDDDHKEIHFSLGYISRIARDRVAHEITGVLTHELVHCYQYNAHGSCPGGLIEGIADWVRLNCDLSPPHWKREADGKWDGGYQHTAYFLDYLEDRFGDGTVRRLNEKLRIQRYKEETFWTELLGHPVAKLWAAYADKLKDDEAVVVNKEDASGADKITTCETGGN